MKKILLILIMILAFSPLKAQSAVMSPAEVKSVIAKHVIENCKKYTEAQVSVEVTTVPFKELVLPDGKVSFVISSAFDKFMPRDLEKVSVFVNNKFIRTFNAPVVIKVYEEVLVASCFIERDKEINSNVVEVKKVEISNNMDYSVRANYINRGMLSKKAFRQGEVLDTRFVKVRPDVFRNSNVTVMFNTNNLTISIEAIALSSGSVGDNICLINKNYNKVYTGKIIGENKVLVKI